MKNLLTLLLPIFLFFACDEIPPNVGMGTTGPEPEPNEVVQKVLIEEFTGVRCVNCPAGSEAIEQLISIHGDRLFAVSIHAGQFSFPYNESKYDFKVEDGVSLLSFLGEPQGFPTAVVSRRVFDGKTDMQLSKSEWAGFIDQELAKEATVKIDLAGEINDGRVLSATATVDFLSPPSNADPKITLIITESNIKDYQETPEGKMADYKHKHVLRDVITPFDGESISFTSGESSVKEFTYNIPDEWNTAELLLIAVIHNSGTDKEILQVEALDF